jgi:hypothetical protein
MSTSVHQPGQPSDPNSLSLSLSLSIWNHFRALFYVRYSNLADAHLFVFKAYYTSTGARTLRAKCTDDRIYQFQSSSSSSGVEGATGARTAITSGSSALPRAVLPVSSSSSINDCVGGADAGARFAVDPGASAENIECDTSERSTEARFWLFENLRLQTKTQKKEQGEQRLRGASVFVRVIHSRLSFLKLCQSGPDRVHPNLCRFSEVRTSEA